MEIRSRIMTREEFNNLDVGKQVNYFNEKLKDADNNFNKLCRSIGVSKNTIINRFKNNGYVMCKDGQKISALLIIKMQLLKIIIILRIKMQKLKLMIYTILI